MTVRAKFKVEAVQEQPEYSSTTITMRPVIDGSEENKQFWEYTPSGLFSLTTTNKKAAEQLVLGKEYYIDISEAN